MDKKPYKIVDRSGSNKCGVVAASLDELIVKAQEKFGIPCPVRVLLESDGTLVDEESYFSTREPDTCFLILRQDEQWPSSSEDISSSTSTLLKRPQADHESQNNILGTVNKQINTTTAFNLAPESRHCFNCNHHHR